MHYLRISRECFSVVRIEILLIILSFVLIPVAGIAAKSIFLILLVSVLGTLFFFRDPERRIPEDKGAVVAPADGRIVDISRQHENQFCNKEVMRISIFLSIIDVHINRMPVSGTVRFFKYNPGKFSHAASHRASLDNEHTMVGVETEDGTKLLIKQIAGFIARRIVCHAKINMEYAAGERFGMIKFGSRTDLFLPVGTQLNICKGDKVYGGMTIIGTINQIKGEKAVDEQK